MKKSIKNTVKSIFMPIVVVVLALILCVTFTACGGGSPYIGENGNWYINDVDTGVPATGAQGEKGDKGDTGAQGEKGDKGDAGYTPQKGTDYWTEADKQEIIDGAAEKIYTYGTADLTAGISPLDTGKLYFVYEE